MEEVLKYIDFNKYEIHDEGKEAECLDETSPDEMEEVLNDRNDNKNEKYDEEKQTDETTDSDSTTIGKGIIVVDKIVIKDVDLD